MTSMASGNWAENLRCRRERRNLSTRNGSTTPANSAASTACSMLPSNIAMPAKVASMPTMANRMSLEKPMVRPDCSTSWLRLTIGSR